MLPIKHITPSLLFLAWSIVNTSCHSDRSQVSWTFVSMPDFLNVDCDYPQKGWEESLTYILESINKENPDFLVIPGDLVMGHWDDPQWNSKDTIAKYADRYYSAWMARMKYHGLQFYTSVGDHELGDNPWKDSTKIAAIAHYRNAFKKHLKMPLNGPDHLKGTAFWLRHKNVLFISVDVFEQGQSSQGAIKAGETGEQLDWLIKVLLANNDAEHKIILGHTPILGPVRKWSSSGLMIEEGQNSELWQTMKTYQVDAYLCGEVHAITCSERDGIMQIAHGGLIGYNTRTNYMVVKITGDKLEFLIKEIELMPRGGHLWQTKNNRPLHNVVLSDASRKAGFYLVGSTTLNQKQVPKFSDRKGYFAEQYEFSTDQAAPIFRKNTRPGIITELPKIVVQ
ncbi:MAG: metallophosphoesterase [Saprospiraceae bacterium]|nr:metallophosphoesterase [Saprospiraceae bacterium]